MTTTCEAHPLVKDGLSYNVVVSQRKCENFKILVQGIEKEISTNDDTGDICMGRICSDYVTSALQKCDILIVIEEKGGKEVVAFAALVLPENLGTLFKESFIAKDTKSIYIDLICARKGFGRILYEAIKKVALKNVKDFITLHAIENATPVYERWGFMGASTGEGSCKMFTPSYHTPMYFVLPLSRRAPP